MDKEDLFNQALEMKERAYTPYSHFKVGASVLADNGKLYGGCNIEIASYSPTICAERVAIFKAISDGAKRIEAIAVTGDAKDTMPCGVCRQVLVEFADPGAKVYIVNGKDDFKEYTLEEILPYSFSKSDLGR